MARSPDALLLMAGPPKRKPGGLMGSTEDEGSEGMGAIGDAKQRAVSDFFAAGKRGDMKAATEAFKRAYDACVAAHESEDEETDEAY